MTKHQNADIRGNPRKVAMEPGKSIPHVVVRRLTGAEPFHRGGNPLGFGVLQFWSWSASDLASNNLRGHLAEFLVATALNASADFRIEWDAHDIRLASGYTVEVKSSAYIQSWVQKSGPTKICFDIAPRTSWDSVTNEYLTTVKRHSDIYVFCAEVCTDRASFDPLNLDQWRFFVLPARTLDEMLGAQKKLALGRLTEVGAIECDFDGISAAVAAACALLRTSINGIEQNASR